MIWNETRNNNLQHDKYYEAYFSTRSFFNPCWFNLLHLSQNFNCGIVHLPILSTFSTDKHGMSFGVRFISRNALSSVDAIFLLLQVLRFVPFLALRPRFHVTSGNSLKRCIKLLLDVFVQIYHALHKTAIGSGFSEIPLVKNG